jgi:TetR/AcrR family transcriptional regulator, copper-responsive repressor
MLVNLSRSAFMGAGRQRRFDKEQALQTAMEVFWKSGYAGTSLADLTQALGINKPSLYAAFGNKEQLFISALKHYAVQHGAPHAEALFTPNKPLRERVEAYLMSVAKMGCNVNNPGGCFFTSSICESGNDGLPEQALKLIAELNKMVKQMLVDFFQAEKQQGNLPITATPEGLALFILAVTNGMAVLAKHGAPIEDLEKLIAQAVSVL